MNRDKKLRRLKHLVYKVDKFRIQYEKKTVIEHLDSQIKLTDSVSGISFIRQNHKDYCELKQLFIELEMSDLEYRKICYTEREQYNSSRESLKLNNLKETRDNKGVYVGSGNRHGWAIRYPKKARSKRVWATFYKMFPHRAEVDGWDGEKSLKVSK